MSTQGRILTTHCGSLPRPPTLSAMLLAQKTGEAVDAEALRTETANSVAAVVDAQMQVGIDIVSDGEQPRVGFSMYVPLRMKGFGGQAVRPIPRDLEEFPQFLERLRQRRGQRNKIDTPPKAIAEVSYTGIEDAKAEYDLFKTTLGSLSKKPVDAFM